MSTKSSKGQFGNYDFGLDTEEEARATRLHNGSIIADMMYWGPCTYLSYTQAMQNELDTFWATSHDPSKTSLLGIQQPMRLAVAGKLPEYKQCCPHALRAFILSG